MKRKTKRREETSNVFNLGLTKFEMDGSVRGKRGQAGIGGALRIANIEILALSSGRVDGRESNVAEKLTIKEALRVFKENFHGQLIMESDSRNIVIWAWRRICRP